MKAGAAKTRVSTSTLRPFLIVGGILLAGLLLKGILLGSQSVSFDSDEAVVGLMAKHILDGERPVFFYGQTYMGSLDAFLTAIAFRLFGVSVFSMRLVQLCLFALLILSTYRLALRIFGDESKAGISALLIALPPPLISLYTTITLGGYAETLLFGVWILNLGHQITHEAQDSWLHWALFGLIGGIAFWTLPMIVIYVLPVALAILLQWRWRRVGRVGLAILAFVVGSSPWWGYCLGNCQACLAPYTNPAASSLTGSNWLEIIGFRAFSLVFLGLPAVWGLRQPWVAKPASLLLSIPILALYIGALLNALRGQGRRRWLLLALAGSFLLAFLLSAFGNDATGRYLLPLYLPFSFWVADLLGQAWRRRHLLAQAALVLLLAFNVGMTAAGAATQPMGMTGQLDARFQYGNRHDAELIAFLTEQGECCGYSHYWVAFKINFLSDEKLTIAARLPYKADLTYDPLDDRYPAYSMTVDTSPAPPFFVTSSQSDLEERLRTSLAKQEISYKEKAVGPYQVFYNLSAHIAPAQLGLYAQE